MINNKPLISVIMPIYNGEKWLPISLGSLLAQTFTDFEILLINDGSVDASEKICQSFLEQDTRIRYFYKKNGGVSSARNLGLEKALGKFIYFFDCDDVLAPDIIELLVKLQEDTGADIVSCSCMEVHKQAVPTKVKQNADTNIIIATDDKWNYMDNFMGAISCKLFSLQVIGETCFSEQLYYAEDGLFFVEVFSKARKIVYCPVIKAFYYIHEESTTHKAQPYSFFTSFVLAKSLIKEKIYAATDNTNIRDLVYRDYCTSLFSLFRYAIHSSDKKEYELLQKKYFEILEEFLNKGKIPVCKKLEYKTYIKSYKLARLIHARKI